MNILNQFAQYYSNVESSRLFEESSSAATAGNIGLFLFGMTFIVLVSLGLYAVTAYMLSRVFKKAGVKQWIAWVPFYNTWKILEMGGQQGFWAVLSLVPFVSYVSLVFVYIAMYKIGLKFGKEGWWVVLAILVPVVWIAILAFDSSKWHGEKPAVTA